MNKNTIYDQIQRNSKARADIEQFICLFYSVENDLCMVWFSAFPRRLSSVRGGVSLLSQM